MSGIGLISALDVAVSGMFVSQMATQVINHNIANANTPGYSRQFLRIGSQDPLQVTYGSIGRGATSLGVERAQNDFLQQQLVDQSALLGDYTAMDGTLRSVEEVLGGLDNDRIRTAMGEFFEAWQGLSLDTNSDGAREAVVGATANLARQFNQIDSSLAQIERDTRDTFEAYVTDVNAMLNRVADLNGRIVAESAGGHRPNDLMDQRQQVLDALAETTRFTTNERGDGSVDVMIEGRAVVTRSHVNELRVQESTTADGGRVQEAVFGGKNPVVVPFQAGALAGYQRMSNDMVPGIRAQLDELASEIIRRVNDLHESGVTAEGVGVSLFNGNSAATMSINEAVANNNRLVAAGRDGTPGDNTLAKDIANLGATVVDGHDRSLDDMYFTFIGGVANDRGLYDSLLSGQQGIVESARTRLEAEKGVNIDEELANLVIYQRSYEANARVVRAVDEMLATLVGII
ncbi:MAG TPA: flagellar hook-associated protein FlgK [Candidatus Krumholzibacteria bacterium]|nr:flagellar hook-associated protein FlgK [Candidatus Krumholzibacteria bacterium]